MFGMHDPKVVCFVVMSIIISSIVHVHDTFIDELHTDFIQKPLEIADSKKIVQVESFQIITEKPKSPTVKTKSDMLPLTNGNVNGHSVGEAQYDDILNDQQSHSLEDNISSEPPPLPTAQSNEEADNSQSSETDKICEKTSLQCDTRQGDATALETIPNIGCDIETACSVKSDDILHENVPSDDASPQERRRIVSHRPPFISLREAWNFVNNPQNYKHLLETTKYENITSNDEMTPSKVDHSKQAVRSSSYESGKGSPIEKTDVAKLEIDRQQQTTLVTQHDDAEHDNIQHQDSLREPAKGVSTQKTETVLTSQKAIQDNLVTSSIADKSQEVCRPKTTYIKDLSPRKAHKQHSIGARGESSEHQTVAAGGFDYNSRNDNHYRQNDSSQTDHQNYYDQQYYYNQKYFANGYYHYPGQAHDNGCYNYPVEAHGSYPFHEQGADNFSCNQQEDSKLSHKSESHHYDFSAYSPPGHNSACNHCGGQPQDKLQQTLSKHYRQVYIQQSYIRAMASRRSN